MASSRGALASVAVIAIAAIGGGILYSNGTLSNWMHSKPPAPPVGSAQVAPSSGSNASASPGSSSDPSNNIFGIGGSSAATPSGPPQHFPIAPVIQNHPPAVTPPAIAPAIPEKLAPSLQDARAKVDAATTALQRTLANNPDYKQAQAAIAAADTQRKAALAAEGAGSPEVLTASQQWLDAKAKLQKIIAAAAAKDPASQAAHRELLEAEAAGRAGKGR